MVLGVKPDPWLMLSMYILPLSYMWPVSFILITKLLLSLQSAAKGKASLTSP